MTRRLIALALLGSSLGALAQQANQANQAIVPQVERRPIAPPKFPSKDFELGAFVGTYATQNFGASAVAGLRLGYHLSEDFFVLGTLGSTRVSDESFRQILPGGVFGGEKKKLSYYNLAAGYNLLPGEVFLGGKQAKASQFYVLGGVGSTRFDSLRRQTFSLGAGLRVYFTDKLSAQIDAREHIFDLDILGKPQSTKNLEFSGGLSWFF